MIKYIPQQTELIRSPPPPTTTRTNCMFDDGHIHTEPVCVQMKSEASGKQDAGHVLVRRQATMVQSDAV